MPLRQIAAATEETAAAVFVFMAMVIDKNLGNFCRGGEAAKIFILLTWFR